MLRRQLPAYSPLSLSGILRGLLQSGDDALDALRLRLTEGYDASRVVLTGSGTQALTLALRHSVAAGSRPRVALPAYGCFDLATAAVGADATILLYDVDPRTLGPEWSSLEEVCSAEPDAVVIAPLYGLPVDWDEVEARVRSSGALLVEDAAQGFGASWRGRPLGSLGDVSILSFGRGKGWTGGQGGALLERRPRREAPQPRTPGALATPKLVAKVLAQWALGRPRAYWIPAALPGLSLGETIYHPPGPIEGMPPVAAALAIVHEEAAIAAVAGRKRRGEEYRNWIEGGLCCASLQAPEPVPSSDPAYLRFPVLEGGPARKAGGRRDAARLGVLAGYPIPLSGLAPVAERRFEGHRVPGAAGLARGVLTLPTHSFLSSSDLRGLRAILG